MDIVIFINDTCHSVSICQIYKVKLKLAANLVKLVYMVKSLSCIIMITSFDPLKVIVSMSDCCKWYILLAI